jgi:hypothetical protein
MVKLKVFIHFQEEIFSDKVSDNYYPYRVNSLIKMKGFDEKELEFAIEYDLFNGIRFGEVEFLVITIDDKVYENYKDILISGSYIYLYDKMKRYNTHSLKITKIIKMDK